MTAPAKFEPGQRLRLPLATRTYTGTVVSDDGHHVRVRWDHGKDGDLIRDNAVAYNANRLQVLEP